MSKEFDDMNQAREVLDRARSSLDSSLSHWYEAKSAYENAYRAWQLNLARPAPETSSEPGMHRNQVIARARMAHGGKWPAELTSGVMFYEGMRVTREDFEHR